MIILIEITDKWEQYRLKVYKVIASPVFRHFYGTSLKCFVDSSTKLSLQFFVKPFFA